MDFKFEIFLIALLLAGVQQLEGYCPPLPYSTTTAANKVPYTGSPRPRCPCIGDFYTKYPYDPRSTADDMSIILHLNYYQTAQQLYWHASLQSTSLYPSLEGWDDKAEAFIYVYWNYLMNQEFGDRTIAKAFSDKDIRDVVESEGSSNMYVGSVIMRVHNSHLGRLLNRNSTLTVSDPKNILAVLDNGMAQIEPLSYLQTTTVYDYNQEWVSCQST